jgi:hypothetical protein
VTKNLGGGWDAKRAGGSRVSSHHDRQRDAYDAARDFAGHSGGGEVRIHGTDGKIRNSNTIGKPIPTRHATRSTDATRQADAGKAFPGVRLCVDASSGLRNTTSRNSSDAPRISGAP